MEKVVIIPQADQAIRISGALSISQPLIIRRQSTEEYDEIEENQYRSVAHHPLSMFSIDVDAASYSNVRRMVNEDNMPDKGTARIEQMINYFNYDYPDLTSEHPFSINPELGPTPWNQDHQLVHIGI